MRGLLEELLCLVFGHKWEALKDSGVHGATAGGVTGDSFLEGNEELLGAMNQPMVTGLRIVIAREVVFVCHRCQETKLIRRWAETHQLERLSMDALRPSKRETPNG